MLAYDYPILGIFWTMLMLFLWIAWFVIFFHVLIDIFRSHDLGGWGKFGWVVVVALLPLIGVLIYLLARGDEMQERDLRRVKAQREAMDSYVRDAAGSSGVADELTKLSGLKDSGVITDEEFQQQKTKLLA